MTPTLLIPRLRVVRSSRDEPWKQPLSTFSAACVHEDHGPGTSPLILGDCSHTHQGQGEYYPLGKADTPP